jgi:hypothetical protein
VYSIGHTPPLPRKTGWNLSTNIGLPGSAIGGFAARLHNASRSRDMKENKKIKKEEEEEYFALGCIFIPSFL